MKQRAASLILALALVLGLVSCGRSASTWQEQYDLGVRYLSEGNYEEAIIAFTAAIEIDPNRAEAYLWAGEAYILQNNFDGAIAVLTQGFEITSETQLQERIEELTSGRVLDYLGRETLLTHYDSDGQISGFVVTNYGENGGTTTYSYSPAWELRGYEISEFSETETGIEERLASYNEDEVLEWVQVYEYNSDGDLSKESSYDAEEELESYTIYDREGYREIGSHYNKDDNLHGYTVIEYTEDNRPYQSSSYDENGALLGYIVYEYDPEGTLIGQTFYDGDGTLTGRSEW